jgi:hypothetical protein
MTDAAGGHRPTEMVARELSSHAALLAWDRSPATGAARLPGSAPRELSRRLPGHRAHEAISEAEEHRRGVASSVVPKPEDSVTLEADDRRGRAMATERATETRDENHRVSSFLEGLLDLEFEAFCAREGDEDVTLDRVREATASIPGSMAEAVVEDERADRF